MSAVDAWDTWEAQIGNPSATGWRSGVSPHLGSLTIPNGPPGTGHYLYKDQLAFGFAGASGCVGSHLPPNMSPQPVSSAGCTDWIFLDANTGRFLLEKFVPN
jgi:hypothetical protein